MKLIDLQNAFIQEVLSCLNVPWDRVEIHYEYFEWRGIPLEQSTSDSFRGDHRDDLDLSFDAFEVMRQLRIAKPDGQPTNWTSFDFHLDSEGRYRFDFGYDTPPMAARTIRSQPEES